MNFQGKLDDEGKKIYNEFVKARTEWIKYIKPKAFQHFNEFVEKEKRYFDRYEYLHSNMFYERYGDKKNNIQTANKVLDKELTAKYKKLSLLFHPDKFINPRNNEFFILINKFYNDNNKLIINAIDLISHFILELEDLDNVITNLNRLDISSLLENYTNADDIFSILNNPNLDTLGSEENPYNIGNVNEECYNDAGDMDFLNSVCYKFYRGNDDIQKYVKDKFITEEEIIERIKNSNEYDDLFLEFCAEKYKSNNNILIALCEVKMKENEKLRKKKEEMEELCKKNEELLKTKNQPE